MGMRRCRQFEIADSSPITEEFVSFKDSTNQSDYSLIITSFETENNEAIPVSESDLDGRALICTHDSNMVTLTDIIHRVMVLYRQNIYR